MSLTEHGAKTQLLLLFTIFMQTTENERSCMYKYVHIKDGKTSNSSFSLVEIENKFGSFDAEYFLYTLLNYLTYMLCTKDKYTANGE